MGVMETGTGTGLTFHEAGIANTLQLWSLSVPLNQRQYAWTEDFVDRLLSDLQKAFDKSTNIYFLGMIVLTRGSKDQLEIADGQQRLATTSILISAVRDYLVELGDAEGAANYEKKYLLDYDPRTKTYLPKLRLNSADRDFFEQTILRSPSTRTEYQGRSFSSHDHLRTAANLAKKHLRNLTLNYPSSKEKLTRLYDWMDFLQSSAKVIAMTVPGHVGNSFKMFETLNARSLRASQVDILKNFLYDQAKDRLADLEPRWTSMLSTIESMGEDDLLITYIRHFWIATHGPTTEPELGQKIEDSVASERQAIETVTALDAFASDYIALLRPRDHPRWEEYSQAARNCIYTVIRELRAEQIRPLMLSIARYLPIPEAEKAFAMCLTWSVRFLIAGGGGGGVLDRHYGLRAMEISNREITTAKMLAEKMSGVVPNNEVFKSTFSTATVRLARLARYYHRSIDLYLKDDPKPQFVPNDDTTAVNIEHILPVNPNDEWQITPDVAASYHRRLGNMVLLGAKDNVKIGNKTFKEKQEVFKDSPYNLTVEVSKYTSWGIEEIKTHQLRMAELAPKVWPL